MDMGDSWGTWGRGCFGHSSVVAIKVHWQFLMYRRSRRGRQLPRLQARPARDRSSLTLGIAALSTHQALR